MKNNLSLIPDLSDTTKKVWKQKDVLQKKKKKK